MGHFFEDTFAVVYGDAITDFDLRAMIQFHQEKSALATLALLEVSNRWEVGIVMVDEDSRVTKFVEKPPKGTEAGNIGSGGVYVLQRGVFDYIPRRGVCDFAYDVFSRLIELGLPVYGYVLGPGDYLIDIGTPEKYHQTSNYVKAGKLRTSYG